MMIAEAMDWDLFVVCFVFGFMLALLVGEGKKRR